MLSGGRLLSFRVPLQRLIERLTSQLHDAFPFAKQVNLTLNRNKIVPSLEAKCLNLSV